MNKEIVLDVRELPPRERHPKIFGAWQRLPVGSTLKLLNDHDPKPLFYEFRAERVGEFEWTPLERGPEVWSVAITRTAKPARSGAITPDMTVNEIATRYPKTLAVLTARGLDTCCGGAHPLQMAAQAHGVDLGEVLAELNDAAGAVREPARPSWATEPAGHVLDVRADLLDGKEPFGVIMNAVRSVKKGETLLLRAIFEPKPLYRVLGGFGFEHYTEEAGEQDWKVFFRKG